MNKKQQKIFDKKRDTVVNGLCSLSNECQLEPEEFIFECISFITTWSMEVAHNKIAGLKIVHAAIGYALEHIQTKEVK